MQQFQARGSFLCLCEELDPLAPKVRARCGGSSLLSGHELLEGCSHVSGRGGSGRGLFFRFFLRNSSLEYSVLKLDFVSMLRIYNLYGTLGRSRGQVIAGGGHGIGLGAVITATVVEFVELIRGKVLVYRVVDSEFSLHDD